MTKRESTKHIRGTRVSSMTGELCRIILIVLAALSLVLSVSFLTVGCSDDATESASSDANGDATVRGPEQVVREFLTAMENKDIDAVFELQGPQYVAEMLAKVEDQGLTIDDLKQMSIAGMFPYDSMKFSDIELSTSDTGNGVAVVTIVGGSFTQTVDGVTETKDATDSDFPPEIHLVQVDGEWYVDLEAMGGGE